MRPSLKSISGASHPVLGLWSRSPGLPDGDSSSLPGIQAQSAWHANDGLSHMIRDATCRDDIIREANGTKLVINFRAVLRGAVWIAPGG